MSLKSLLNDNLEEVLESGRFKKRVKVSEKLFVTLSPLSEDQFIEMKLSIPDQAKKDMLTYASFEGLEILSRAIVEVNDVNVLTAAKEDLEKENEENRINLEKFAVNTVRAFLKKLPPRMLNYLQEEYNNVVREQSDAIRTTLGGDIENF